jgi:putative addiction module component (TIGR02574 family)
MAASLDFRTLPVAERLQLVGKIWDSIAEDQASLSDSATVVKEVRERQKRFLSNPNTAVAWEQANKNIRSERG